jgi:hypothetical protein
MTRRSRGERGAILVQVAVLLIVLIGMTALVVDYGLLWVSRRQAQNAADAAALAGAIARAFDEPGDADPAPDGTTVQNINAVVDRNGVAGERGSVNGRTWSWACPPEWSSGRCVRVNVFRNGEESSPVLPVFFAQAFGVSLQGTRATATAITAPASFSNCLKPWLIPDKFEDVDGNGEYNDGDIYTNPGWTDADIGTTLVLNPGRPQDAAAPSHFYQVDVTDYYDDIVTCQLAKGIGDTIDTAPGLSNGLTRNGVADLIAANDGNPVTVVIGMFSPVQFESNRQTGNFDLEIVNMMGFEIAGMTGNALYGRIVGAPGEIVDGYEDTAGNILQKIMLVR